jgi:magnesium-transporting ATPase (P-type)
VNFYDPMVDLNFKNKLSTNSDYLEKVFTHLALCHSIILDERTQKYNSSSPDELALVNAAKFFDVVFLKRDEDNNIKINFKGELRQYKLLNILEFNSTRKRMSVIIQDDREDIYILTKGADSVIFPRLKRDIQMY